MFPSNLLKAPELALLEEKGISVPNFSWKKCDIWSLGVTLAQIIRCGEPLFTASSLHRLLYQILQIEECRNGASVDLLSKYPFANVWSSKRAKPLEKFLEVWTVF